MEQLGEMFNRQKMALISKWGSTFIAYYGTLCGISLKRKFEMWMEHSDFKWKLIKKISKMVYAIGMVGRCQEHQLLRERKHHWSYADLQTWWLRYDET